jgi:TolA-binding protein
VAAGHYAQKRWELAAEAFQTFVEQYPEHPKANQGVFFLAEALLQAGRLEEAATHFHGYLRREPEGPFARPASFRAGEAPYLAGKSDSAKPQLERFLAAYPGDKLNGYVLPYLGDIALSQGDAATAEKSFRQALSEFPQGPMQDECRLGLARSLERQKRTDEAERFYTALAAKTGSRLADDAQFYLGAMQYASGRLEEAVRTFEPFDSTLAESPCRPTAQLGRAWALLKLGRLAEGASILETVASDPKVGPQARYWLGLAQKAQEEWPAAAQTLLEAAADYPSHDLVPAMRFHAGDALMRAGEMKAAAEQFDQVITSAPSDSQWIDNAMLGQLQVALRTQDYAALDRQAAQFARRFPEGELSDDVRRILAQSLLERKQYQRAVETLEPPVAAAKEAHQGLQERYLLALAYEGLERHQDALDALMPVVDTGKDRLRADAQMAQASLLIKLGRFREAIDPLEALLATHPTGDEEVRALGNLAICYAQTHEFDKAQELHAQLVEKHPNHRLIASTTEQLAEAAYNAGEAVWSNQWFSRLASQSASSEQEVKGWSGLAWSQYRAGQLEEAAATFNKLLDQAPDSPLAPEAALTRGRILQQLGHLDAALAMYDRVIDRHAKSDEFPQALWAAALLRDSLAQDQEAVALYERLAAAYPQFPEIDAVLYNWAWTLDDLDRKDKSCALFDRLCQEHPQSGYRADATYRLAQRAFQAQDYDRAGQLVADVLAGKTSPEIEQNALYLQGQIAAAGEKWDEACQSFETLLKGRPDEPLRLMAEYGLAEAAFRQRDYPAAVQRFQRLARQTQDRDEPWLAVVPLRLAQALCHRKKWDEAYQIASTVEARFPGFPEQYEVDYVIGRCLSTRAEFERARQLYRSVISSPEGANTETAAKAQLMIAESYFHQHDYETALREYLALEILYDYPAWQAAAAYQAGKCHEMLGQWDKATEQYARLLEAYPDTDFKTEARVRMQAARQRAGAEPAS